MRIAALTALPLCVHGSAHAKRDGKRSAMRHAIILMFLIVLMFLISTPARSVENSGGVYGSA